MRSLFLMYTGVQTKFTLIGTENCFAFVGPGSSSYDVPGKSHFVKKKVYILEWRESPKNAILIIM